MDRETYIQLDRIESKIDYIMKILEEEISEEEYIEKGTIVKPKVNTSIKDKKSEIIDE